MISADWNKDSLKSFEKKMETIIKKLPEATKMGVNDSLKNTQEKALKNKRGNKDKNLILIEFMDITTTRIVGRVYTDRNTFDYAPYLEFGTGTKLDPTGPGPKPEHTQAYKDSNGAWWLLPVNKANKKLNNKVVNIDGKLFYVMFATKPYPFMRPASFSSRQENADLVNERVGKLLMEVLK